MLAGRGASSETVQDPYLRAGSPVTMPNASITDHQAESFTIRSCTPADVAGVLRLVRALAEYEKLANLVVASEDDLHRALFGARPFAEAALAEIDGEAVGLVLWFFTFSTFAGRPKLFVEDVFVEPAHRGNGIGLALFHHAARAALAAGCIGMEWTVLTWNQPALDFYQRMGAQPVTDWQTQQLRGDALAALGAGHG
jgi:GNAT superfamily N-acetyltransferase